MNSNLVNVLKEIVAGHGEDALSNLEQVGKALQEKAADEPKPLRVAIMMCLTGGACPELKNAGGIEARQAAKAAFAKKIHDNEGLDSAFCVEALDVIEAAMLGGKTLCVQCGKELQEGWVSCPFCGAGQGEAAPQSASVTVTPETTASPPASPAASTDAPLADIPSWLNNGDSGEKRYSQYNPSKSDKSKIAAGLLAFFLGYLGIHNFYLGKSGKGVAQLLLFICGCIFSVVGIGIVLLIVVGIWELIECIMCFTGTYKDAQGRDLRD